MDARASVTTHKRKMTVMRRMLMARKQESSGVSVEKAAHMLVIRTKKGNSAPLRWATWRGTVRILRCPSYKTKDSWLTTLVELSTVSAKQPPWNTIKHARSTVSRTKDNNAKEILWGERKKLIDVFFTPLEFEVSLKMCHPATVLRDTYRRSVSLKSC